MVRFIWQHDTEVAKWSRAFGIDPVMRSSVAAPEESSGATLPDSKPSCHAARSRSIPISSNELISLMTGSRWLIRSVH